MMRSDARRVGHAKGKEKKGKKKRLRPFGLVWELKQNREPFSHFGVSSTESKTQLRALA